MGIKNESSETDSVIEMAVVQPQTKIIIRQSDDHNSKKEQQTNELKKTTNQQANTNCYSCPNCGSDKLTSGTLFAPQSNSKLPLV